MNDLGPASGKTVAKPHRNMHSSCWRLPSLRFSQSGGHRAETGQARSGRCSTGSSKMSRAEFRDRSDPVSRHDRADHGQATVEFALILPLIVGVIALIVQITIISVSRLEVVDETRHVARIASLAEDPRTAASKSLPIGSTSSVDVVYDDTSVTVTVSRRIDTTVPIIGRFIPTVDVRSRLVMAREPPSL
jgi:hypothetical protein